MAISRLIVFGSRGWTDYQRLKEAVRKLNPDAICHGGARGADTLAALVGEELGIPVRRYLADWTSHGRSAGIIRNRQMLEEFRPVMGLGATMDLRASRGTFDMMSRLLSAGIPVLMISEPHTYG